MDVYVRVCVCECVRFVDIVCQGGRVPTDLRSAHLACFNPFHLVGGVRPLHRVSYVIRITLNRIIHETKQPDIRKVVLSNHFTVSAPNGDATTIDRSLF